MASEKELKDLSRWTAELWKVYQRVVLTKISQEDIDYILAEVKRIWLESGQNELIEDMGIAFLNDIDRRAVQ